ncbi:MAG: acyl-CoA dehydrogenase family protein [Polyangiaceae bacterium]|nr:acyl-CoA dehydrogenase family protein [Polyangiaceae bacterium]
MQVTWRALPTFFEAAHVRLGDDIAASMREDAFVSDDPRRIVERLGQLGVFRLLRTCDSVRALCVARELLAYRSPLADAIFAAQGLAACVLVLAGGEQWRGRLQDAAAGRVIGGFALTEPEAGSDMASIRSTARLVSGTWLLDGHKTLIANVGIAGFFVVFANVDPSMDERGITAFLVEAHAPGLGIEPLPTLDGQPVGGLMMRGVPAQLLGEIGHGMRLALGASDVFRPTVGAAAVGMAQRALDEVVPRMVKRIQFGHPLASFQLVQGAIADMATDLEAARVLVARAAWAKDTRCAKDTDVPIAKMFATEAAGRIVDRAVQLFGGAGLLGGGVVERLYRSVRALRIHEGPTEIQKILIARSLIEGARGPSSYG